MALTPDQKRFLGLQIQQRREEVSTQDVFAREIGVTQAYLSQIENGQRVPSMETLSDIADALDCHVWEILRDAVI